MNTISSLSSLILVLAVVGGVRSHNCSEVVTVESHGLLNYLASVSFTAPHNLSGEWIMDLATDVEYTFLGGWKIWITSDPSEGKAMFRSRQDDLEIQKGDLISFRFRISWSKGEAEPEIISLIWDGEQICDDNGKTLNDIKASRASRIVDNNRRPSPPTPLGREWRVVN